MITVPELVEKEIKNIPFLEEGLSLKIINLSSLARKLQPKIQKTLLKDIKLGAIIMALKRLEEKLQTSPNSLTTPARNASESVAGGLIPLTDLTVRSNLVEFTFTNSPTLIAKQSKFLASATQEKNAYLTFTYGVFETTLIVSQSLQNQAEKLFEGEVLRSKFTNLSSITLILSKAAVFQPGTYYQILKKLAWEGINIIEVFSSFTELTIVLENNQVDRAFSTLKTLS